MGTWKLKAISIVMKDPVTCQEWPIPVDLKLWGGMFWEADKPFLKKVAGWEDRHFDGLNIHSGPWTRINELSVALIIKEPSCIHGPIPVPSPASLAGHPCALELRIDAEDGEGSTQSLVVSKQQMALFAGVLWDINPNKPSNKMLEAFYKEMMDHRASHPSLFQHAEGLVVFLDLKGQPHSWY